MIGGNDVYRHWGQPTGPIKVLRQRCGPLRYRGAFIPWTPSKVHKQDRKWGFKQRRRKDSLIDQDRFPVEDQAVLGAALASVTPSLSWSKQGGGSSCGGSAHLCSLEPLCWNHRLGWLQTAALFWMDQRTRSRRQKVAQPWTSSDGSAKEWFKHVCPRTQSPP